MRTRVMISRPAEKGCLYSRVVGPPLDVGERTLTSVTGTGMGVEMEIPRPKEVRGVARGSPSASVCCGGGSSKTGPFSSFSFLELEAEEKGGEGRP